MTHIPAAMLGVCITILVTYLFSRYEIRVGKRVGSPSLIADGEHVRADMFSTLVVLASLGGQYFGYHADKLAAGVVVLFIAHAGWDILFEGVKVLLDASLDQETLRRIRKILLAESIVREIKSLTGRNSGSYKFIEADIVVNAKDLEQAHMVSQHIEQNIMSQIQNVDHVLIHYEPIHKDALLHAAPLHDRDGALSEHYGDAPYIGLFTKHCETGKILEQKIIENPFLNQEKGKGIVLSEFLVEHGVDVVHIKAPFHGKGPEYVLADANVETALTNADRFDELMVMDAGIDH